MWCFRLSLRLCLHQALHLLPPPLQELLLLALALELPSAPLLSLCLTPRLWLLPFSRPWSLDPWAQWVAEGPPPPTCTPPASSTPCSRPLTPQPWPLCSPLGSCPLFSWHTSRTSVQFWVFDLRDEFGSFCILVRDVSTAVWFTASLLVLWDQAYSAPPLCCRTWSSIPQWLSAVDARLLHLVWRHLLQWSQEEEEECSLSSFLQDVGTSSVIS